MAVALDLGILQMVCVVVEIGVGGSGVASGLRACAALGGVLAAAVGLRIAARGFAAVVVIMDLDFFRLIEGSLLTGLGDLLVLRRGFAFGIVIGVAYPVVAGKSVRNRGN